ncbi:helix-turn-helix domain-containing protein [Breznakia pachnodae]|uniref:Transcriptional regulator with XRE-family HTH domain n=1 Tax=Breznakia pachnodae TaxID=265178 RepID=A0ABU0E5F0_9FIRM|nr:helix-turn-helix transcriptional regulator [Breznakia pachnodae]MDQ0362051.1 transcriptional regulator with XRE-family HTH domain [Breznakia pachnodae]
MDFGEKLKQIRKKRNLSQEQLADEMGVSRQAITKWETGRGMPDIENIKIISELFKMSLDELIYEESKEDIQKEFTYQSEMIYDIDQHKKIDIKMINAKKIIVKGGESEKLKIILSSQTIEHLDSIYKIKIEDNNQQLDIKCIRKTDKIVFDEEEELTISIIIPRSGLNRYELDSKTKELSLEDLQVHRLEFDGKADQISIDELDGSFEFTSKSDCELMLGKWNGSINLCQFKAKAVVYVNQEAEFKLIDKGRKSSVIWKRNGEYIETPTIESNNTVQISSYKSETIIDIFE